MSFGEGAGNGVRGGRSRSRRHLCAAHDDVNGAHALVPRHVAFAPRDAPIRRSDGHPSTRRRKIF
jgi:hypothetical protein